MSHWRSQSFRKSPAVNGKPAQVVDNAVATAEALRFRTRDAPPVFTLRHLAHLTGVSYSFLRNTVERQESEPYRRFRIHKRKASENEQARYRIICVPDPRLMRVQRWINDNILALGNVHDASVAFRKNDNIVRAAEPHCGCRWMIKLDIVNFFESVSEQSVYHAFRAIGYQPLVSFELARLCTRRGGPSQARGALRWSFPFGQEMAIRAYYSKLLGHLPQGAPTSPMLANLAMVRFDRVASEIAGKHGLIYTRYADDLTLSTNLQEFSRAQAHEVIRDLYRALRRHGFQPNLAKTSIVAPGARKVVLGLLVDGDSPRLTKEFRSRLRKHLYYLTHAAHGPARHAAAMRFRSVYSLRNHVNGLIAYARQVDEAYAQQAWAQLASVTWP